jgi:REP element-mobilizing transposase RayT
MKFPLTHGGELAKGRRKTARPFDSRRAMHVVLRSGVAGSSMPSLYGYRGYIGILVAELAHRFGVRVYEKSVNSNHIHLVTRGRDRAGFKRFLMALSGRIAQKVTGAKKGAPQPTKFWESIPWSRILEWGKAYITALRYAKQNALEAEGILAYVSRKRRSLVPNTG